ncbi:MAG: protein of unknown function transrane [Firmicutes bacterium]|nr:protein of unknown function transrane [Bacillota bacterium]
MQLKANLLLLLTAAIWGFAFVAQRVGMDYIQPFTFNGIRFILGGLSLLPLIIYFDKTKNQPSPSSTASSLKAGALAGLVLFIAASLQQIGLIYTTAGKSAFITALYIVLVPFFGIFLRQRIAATTWFGSGIAIIGLYLLCMKTGFTIAYGDFLELIGSFFWAIHILLIDHYSRKVDALKLASCQFIICGLLSLVIAVSIETITLSGITNTALPILYGGICSVGIAYTLQIIGQKHAAPAPAAIILSMETVFAAIGGFLLLGETLSLQEFSGCILMFLGMIISQLPSFSPQKKTATANDNT